MNEQGKIPKPYRVELGASDTEDRNVKDLIDFYKEKKIEVINLDIDNTNEEYSRKIQIEFYSDKDELIDKIEIPYDRDQP